MTKGLYGPEPFKYPDGGVAAGIPVTIYHHATSTKIALYADAAGTIPLANPMTTDVNGLITFYADGGFYDVSANGFLYGIQVVAPGAGAGGALRTVVYTPSSPASTWVIDHNLGVKPTVDYISSTGDEEEPDVSHGSDNQLSIIFPTPVGSPAAAYLRG